MFSDAASLEESGDEVEIEIGFVLRWEAFEKLKGRLVASGYTELNIIVNYGVMR